jgi:2-iminobutanoate/2-iminopropanoate deaminase
MKEVKTNKAQSAKGLLSQAIISGKLVYTAGFIHVDERGNMVDGTATEMFKQVMNNIDEVLKAAGSDIDKIIKATLYVTDISMLPEINKQYVKYFTSPLPAREAVCVKELPLGAKIEMSVVAEI